MAIVDGEGPAGGTQDRQHTLSDWLALHELDQAASHRVLDTIAWSPKRADTSHRQPVSSEPDAIDPEAAWLTAANAMRDLLPDQHCIVDDVLQNTERVLAEQAGKEGKAVTLDNGPSAYPTIIFSFRGGPSDALLVAHEFGHALQIRASGEKFIPPVLREVCAFLGESSLLSYTRRHDRAQYSHLVKSWEQDNSRYFGVQTGRLRIALSRPDTPYRYSWNYPIARHLAMQIHARRLPDWSWKVFEGTSTVREVLQKLASREK